MRVLGDTPMPAGLSLFREDDYDEINVRYFAALRESGRVDADPSGWLDTRSEAATLCPPVEVSQRDLQYYYVDEGSALGPAKDCIVDLISRWEDRLIQPSEVTLFHSVSAATMAVLVVLRRLGIRTIIFETPGYAVTMNQAEHLGLAVVKVPTYGADGFTFECPAESIERHTPCAIWITQPRMSLGYDQAIERVADLASRLSTEDFLVIDEATEQRFPSHLRRLYQHPSSPRIIRLRGLLKGTGLNGLRLSFALHHHSLREYLEASQEVVGGSLDIYSIRAVVAIATRRDHLPEMLEIANAQVVSLREQAEKIAFGSKVEVVRLVNGYIGSLLIDLQGIPGTYDEKRVRLLEFCRDKAMPVITGASMRFAFNPSQEQIRVNYFNSPRHVLRGVSNLVDFIVSAGRQKIN